MCMSKIYVAYNLFVRLPFYLMYLGIHRSMYLCIYVSMYLCIQGIYVCIPLFIVKIIFNNVTFYIEFNYA